MSSFLEKIQSQLNSQQFEAVTHVEGPLLILAGAGSGKTRVLTCRIAHLVYDYQIPLERILAMTFSNKAAREMHQRLKVLLGDESDRRYPWISTFHSVGVRLLRRFGDRLGLDPQFVIYDSNDQLDLIKESLENLRISDKAFHPKAVHARISHWKNEGLFTAQVKPLNFFDETTLQVYRSYQELLRKAQAVDFDDLLLLSSQLCSSNEDIQAQLRGQWQHILVDEFQDTNRIQYRLLKQFLGEHQNISVVGDDDQSIYGWRGARVENILNFDREFSSCKVVKLEENYRSTGHILEAAAAVIEKNEERHQKRLWTRSDHGSKLKLAILEDDREEARFVITEIKRKLHAGVSADQVAVLYRMNSISRMFEEECLRQGLPYKIVGGFRFYERREIKDVLSYLKFIMNPWDLISFRRAIGSPPRGIGRVSLEKIEQAAAEAQESLGNFLIREAELPLSGKAKKGAQAFAELLKWGRDLVDSDGSFVDLLVGLIEKSGTLEQLQQDRSEEARDRESNLQELLSAVQEFEELWRPNSENQREGASLLSSKIFDFLERVALISDVDQLDERTQEQVTFMTFHAAKGLEFPLCFMAAMEEGIFPSSRSIDSPVQLEEERRLCYVGMTRAMKLLYLTRAERRRSFGSINYGLPSRFLDEIPEAHRECIVDHSRSEKAFFKRKSVRDQESATADFDEFDQELTGHFSYRRGEKVLHPSFGEGVVQRVEFLGDDECLTIQFLTKGRKRVLSQFVKKSA
ncbi:MAG: ATP-dependent DNA helicase PcrA [Bradymonadales bacterium]|nr:MAG: ATP-dependent DNA helicase PcrA [Bradymonadales bacterium]